MVFFDGCSDAGGFGVVSVVVGGAFVVDVFVEGLGEAVHGLLFEEAAVSVECKVVSVQLRMVFKYEGLDHGSPGLHHVTDKAGLTILRARCDRWVILHYH